MTYQVQIHETRVYQIVVQAGSEAAAIARAAELHGAQELPGDVYHIETVVRKEAA